MNPTTIKVNEFGYKNLVAAAGMLAAFSKNNARYVVRDVYFDLGQNWMWTTICREGYNDCQVLSPREWENIIFSTNVNELAEAVKDIQNGKYFSD